MIKSTLFKSTVILTIATLVSKILGSIFRIPLQNIAGDEVLGIFSLVYPVYMVALILSVAGLPLAISKLIAEARVNNQDSSAIRDIYITASVLAIAFGVLSFTLIYVFSNELSIMLGGPSTRLALLVVSGTLLVAPYMAIYRGYFQGFEDMRPTAISQVIEQFIRAGLIIIFAYYFTSNSYSNEAIAGGVMLGSIFGAIGSLGYLIVKYHRSNLKVINSNPFTFNRFSFWSKKILTVSIPIAIGSIIMALFNLVDSFTVSFGLRTRGFSSEEINYWYGIYSRGLTLTQISTVFATSVVLPLVPLISKKVADHDVSGTRSIIEQTYQMTYLLSWPVAIGILSLAIPLNFTLFTDFTGSIMFAIIGLSSVFTCLTLVGTGALQGINLAKVAAFIILGGVLFKTILNMILIHFWGLNGAAISTLLVYLLVFFTNTIFIWRKITFSFLNVHTLKVITSAIVMGAIIGIPTWWINFSEWTRLQGLLYIMIAIIIGASIYFIQLYIYKAIDKNLIKYLPIPMIGIKQRGKNK